MKSLLENTRKADITFNCNGTINISARASTLLELQPFDVIDILADNGEYYLYVRLRAPYNSTHECRVMRTLPTGKHYRTYSCRLVRIMLNICGVADKARLTVGDPIDIPPYGTALPIITKRLL